ncbi:DNA-3-methyladenine glycosylase I [uncultured Tessaracoccus sp.]|uniref:DNA-3-methyladenine glycosylase I n=1 Tax=uncultured Tessaracoccus sp. TaxID=905023 RepID=UPI00261BF8A6|nr:DNA-3-methyladenine glycosylase I [uncultured Tessaracoccus sp.]
MTIRCFGTGDALYERYHDEEWGRPLTLSPDERELFERLALEGFQSGLSWLTVLRKRAAFRQAFHEFTPEVVAAYTDDVARLMSDATIIRNERKIRAAIRNAGALVELHAAGGSLMGLLEEHRPVGHRRPATPEEAPSQSAESVALAKRLKQLGFVFVGPVTMYALMQAVGVVDDHAENCWLVTG